MKPTPQVESGLYFRLGMNLAYLARHSNASGVRAYCATSDTLTIHTPFEPKFLNVANALLESITLKMAKP